MAFYYFFDREIRDGGAITQKSVWTKVTRRSSDGWNYRF
jgi:hypothetical protein